MKLSELIIAIGDDNIGVQSIDTCINTIRTVKHGTRVTFDTDQPFDINGLEKHGLIIWIDRDKVKSALTRQTGGSDA